MKDVIRNSMLTTGPPAGRATSRARARSCRASRRPLQSGKWQRAARRVLNGIAMGSGDRSPVASRCDAELPDEGARHVALVGEARQKRGIGWRPACGQEPPDNTHSALDEIG